MKKLRKLLAVVMIVAMMIPVTAFAAEPSQQAINLAECSVYARSAVYNGEVQVAEIRAIVDGKVVSLKKDVDYTLSGARTAQNVSDECIFSINGVGKYTGSATVAFEIVPANLKDFGTVTAKSLTYTGESQTSLVTVKVGSKVLSSADVTIKGNVRKNAGTYKVYAAGKGNYTGVINTTVTVNKAKPTLKGPSVLKVDAAKVKKAAQKVAIKVGAPETTTYTYTSSTKNITVSKSGVATVAKGTQAGTYKVLVKSAATHNYTAGSKIVYIVVK